MKKERLWVLSGVLGLVLVLLVACTSGATPTPTTKATPTPAPASKPALSPSPTAKPPAPTASPAARATSVPAPVSFAGKTITIVVPTAPGGGTDIVGRVYARYLPKFLPGKPAMIVRNIPGGGTTIGANYVYSAKPDGLTLLASTSNAQVQQLLGTIAVKYDLLKMTTVIGTPAGALFYAKSGIIAKAEDLPRAKGLIYGYTAGTAPGTVLFIIAKESLGISTDKVAFGYTGGGDARRAFFSGEINFSYETAGGYEEALAAYVQKGEVMLLFQTGLVDEKGNLVKDSNLPPMLTYSELHEKINGKPPSGLAWDAYKAVIAAAQNFNRNLLLPPGTPDGMIRAYWDASAAMVKDPEFGTVIDSVIGKGVVWGVGETYHNTFKQNFGMKPEIRDWLIAALKKYNIAVE